MRLYRYNNWSQIQELLWPEERTEGSRFKADRRFSFYINQAEGGFKLLRQFNACLDRHTQVISHLDRLRDFLLDLDDFNPLSCFDREYDLDPDRDLREPNVIT